MFIYLFDYVFNSCVKRIPFPYPSLCLTWCVFVLLCVCLCVCMCVCVCVCMFVCGGGDMCVNAYMCLCVCVCMTGILYAAAEGGDGPQIWHVSLQRRFSPHVVQCSGIPP